MAAALLLLASLIAYAATMTNAEPVASSSSSSPPSLTSACEAARAGLTTDPAHLQCDRTPAPCMLMGGMHDNETALDYSRCKAKPTAKDWWPLRDPYVKEEDGVSAMKRLAELLGNRVVVFVGDSISYQNYYSLMCGLARAGDMAEPPLSGPARRVKTLAYLAGAKFAQVQESAHHGTIFVFGRESTYDESHMAEYMLFADVLVINFGLHYAEAELPQYRADIASLGRQLCDFVSLTLHNRTPVAIVRETSAQHFPHSGVYNASDPSHAATGCTCWYVPRSLSRDNLVTRQNDALRRVVDVESNIHLLPFYDVTLERYNMHVQNCRKQDSDDDGDTTNGCCDCTHFCYTPAFWDAISRDMLRVLTRALTRHEDGVGWQSMHTREEGPQDHFIERRRLARARLPEALRRES
eukprot:jgi/Chlat1/455/Chrsp103S01068